MRSRVPAITLACALLLAACGGQAANGAAQSGAPAARVTAKVPAGDWTRFNYDAQRNGVGPSDTGITRGDVRLLRRRRIRVDGTVDASAIELAGVSVRGHSRDVFIFTTTYGKTIALNAGSGAKLWEFVPSDIHRYAGSDQITTATPVADPNRQYVFAASPDGRIHKLSVSTGREVRSGHWPVRVTFDATHEKIASSLNVSGGSVVVTTGGYIGDAPPYQGHVVLIDRGSGHISVVWNSLCSNRHHLIDPPRSCPASDSAIWGRAGAMIEPGTGRILVATGNAPFNGSTNWGDSVLELSPDGRQLLHHWTPSNQAQMNANDLDLGSTSPVVLPPFHGMRLAVQSGKDALLHLLNLNTLAGVRGKAGHHLGGELQSIASPGGDQVFTAPAVWSHGGRTLVLVGDGSGTAAYQLGPHRARLSVAWHDGTAGTSPIIAGGLLYVYDPNGGRLNIRLPGSGKLVASLPAGTGHWNSPIAVGGRVFLPVGNANDQTTHGVVNIYHLPGH